MSTVARINAEINLKGNLERQLLRAEQRIKSFGTKTATAFRKIDSGLERSKHFFPEAYERGAKSAEKSAEKIRRAGQTIASETEKTARKVSSSTMRMKKNWEDFGNSLETVSGKVRSAGLAITAGLTVPIGLLAKSSIDAAAQMEGFTSSTSIILGSAKRAEEQLNALREMSDRTGASFEGLTSASQGMIIGFRGDVENANKTLEKFATLANIENLTNEQFKRMALNLQQIAGAARLTGDEMREMRELSRLFSLYMEKAFGTSRSEDLAKLGISGRQALEGIADAMEKDGLIADMNKYTAQVNQLKNAFFFLKVEVGEALLPIAKDIVAKLIPAFEKLNEKISAMTPEQKKMLVNLLGIAAAIGPVLIALGSIGGAFAGVIKGITSAGSLFSSFLGVLGLVPGELGAVTIALRLITGPIGIAITAVTGLFIAWKKNMFGIQDIVKSVVNSLKGEFADTYNNIIGVTKDFLKMMKDYWGPTLNILGEWIAVFLKYTADEFVFKMKFILDVVNTFLAGLKFMFTGDLSQINDSMRASMLRLASIWQAGLAKVLELVVNFLRTLKALLSPMKKFMGAIGVTLDSFFEFGLDKADMLVNRLKSGAKQLQYMSNYYQKLAESARKANISIDKMPELKTLGGGVAPALPTSPGGSGGKAQKQAQELTAEMLIQMGKSIESTGSKGAAACAMFASKVIAKFTKGITDEGGKIEWSAGNLVKLFKEKLGSAVVDISQALPGSLAFRRGSGPSGYHVGIPLGDGRIMDMNGQRDGRRNTFDIIDKSQAIKEGWKAMNIPAKYMDEAFKSGQVSEGFVQMFNEEMEKLREIERKIMDVKKVQDQLRVAQMKATGARLKDILSIEEYGMVFDDLNDVLKEAKINALEELHVFEESQAKKEAEKAILEAKIQAQNQLNEQAQTTILNMKKEIDLIGERTEVEKMGWEIRFGQFKTINPLMKAMLLVQAKLLDNARTELDYAEKIRDTWKNVGKSIFDAGKGLKDKQNEAQKRSLEYFDDYMKDLTKQMFELSGAFDELLRNDLTEQLSGLFPEIGDTKARAKAIQDEVDKILEKIDEVAQLKEKMKHLKLFAEGMEEIFMDTLDNMFENGFKSFFTDVISGFRSLVRDIASELVKIQIRKAIVWGINQLFGENLNVASLFGGRATGGMVYGGTPYIVGEAGPELFVPSGNGNIVPNHKMGNGSQTTINVNIQTNDAKSFQKSKAQIEASMIAASERARRRNGG